MGVPTNQGLGGGGDADARAGQVGQAVLPAWLEGLLDALPATEEQAGFDQLYDAGLTAAVGLLHRAGSRLEALTAWAVAASTRAGTVRSSGAATTTRWLVATGGGSARKARRTAGRASRLRELPGTARALSEGWRLSFDPATGVVAVTSPGRSCAPRIRPGST